MFFLLSLDADSTADYVDVDSLVTRILRSVTLSALWRILCTDVLAVVGNALGCVCGDVVAVKTERAVPKELVFKVMDEINSATAKDSLSVGDVVIENVAGTGVNVVATANHRK